MAGGIFTKIADIGSDLMKIVFKIKEDASSGGNHPVRDLSDTAISVGDVPVASGVQSDIYRSFYGMRIESGKQN